MLSESVCRLYNLQTLILGHGDFQIPVHRTTDLPKDLHKLINLRHLEMKEGYNLIKMPCRIGELTSLQTLGNFIVGVSDGAARLGELKGLR